MKRTVEPRKGDILIVDDVPENLQLLFTMLTQQGYEVRRVLNGKQALNAAKIEPPDLILLDIKMPDLDGYQVCQKLKTLEQTKEIPVIFLSALNDTFDKVKAFEVGGVDYITKPFHLQEVLIRVENQLKLLSMQRELQEKNKELLLLNQELEAFCYRVPHDLRSPMTQVMVCSDLLNLEYQDQLNEDGQKYITLIYEACIRMEEIIEDLLRLSQSQYIQIVVESFNLTTLLEEIAKTLQLRYSSRQIELIISPDLTIEGDQRLLKIAFENLLENAYKYTAKQEHPRIECGMFVDHEKKVYFVKDNGIGFDPEKAEKLFVPFHRLHNYKDFPGTGIGLTTTQRIIERHGGEIWYEAEPNQGATFFFHLQK